MIKTAYIFLLFALNNDYYYRIKKSMSLIQQQLPVNKSGDLKWSEMVAQNVKSLRYGAVEIIVQDSRVIQIKKTERVRLDNTAQRPEFTS